MMLRLYNHLGWLSALTSKCVHAGQWSGHMQLALLQPLAVRACLQASMCKQQALDKASVMFEQM